VTDGIRRAPLSNRAADWNLALIWVVIILGLLTAIGCVGFILNESLISYVLLLLTAVLDREVRTDR